MPKAKKIKIIDEPHIYFPISSLQLILIVGLCLVGRFQAQRPGEWRPPGGSPWREIEKKKKERNKQIKKVTLVFG